MDTQNVVLLWKSKGSYLQNLEYVAVIRFKKFRYQLTKQFQESVRSKKL
jgi:hypothetical protein